MTIKMDYFPLTPTQQGMLFHSAAAADPSIYLQQYLWQFAEPLDPRCAEAALAHLFERHEILRAAVEESSGAGLRFRVHPRVEVPLQWIDRRETPAQEREQQLQADLCADRARGVDCSVAPAMRIQIFSFSDADHVLVWTYHHAYLDGRSRAIILDDFFAAYQALESGQPPELPPATPFRLYPQWLAAQDSRAARAFWSQLLGDVESPTPLYHASDPTPAQTGIGHREYHALLDAEQTGELKQFAAANDLTINTLIQGAWSLLLSRLSGEQTVVFGAARSGRRVEGLDTSKMAGLLINTLPVKIDLPEEEPLGLWLGRLRALWVEMRPFEHTSPLLLQQCSSVPPATPLFDSILVLETSDLNERCQARGGRWQQRRFDLIEHTHYPLTLQVKVGDALHITLEVAPERFTPRTAERMLVHIKALLNSLVTLPSATPLGELALPVEEELEAMRQRWQRVVTPLPPVPAFTALFERQAQERPDSIALVFHEAALSYRELNARSNQIARYLLEQGVAPGDAVACCLRRSPLLLNTLLGILKAGARFIPLDPLYPAKRISTIMESADHPRVVTERSLLELFAVEEGDAIVLDAAQSQIERCSAENLAQPLGADAQAYLIFTSGSTGQPKGVEIGHQALLNLLVSMSRTPGMGSGDTLLAVTTVAFDIAMLELFMPLIVGGKIILADSTEAADGRRLAQLLEQGVSLLQATPTTWRLLLASGWQGTPKLKMLCGGEALPPDLARSLLKKGGELWNMYGPTETTIWSTCCRVTRGSIRKAGMAIGGPIDNTLVAVVDSQLQLCPVGVAGELVIGGAGVARGYLNRSELTRAAFVPNPFDLGGERLYRTGDRAMYLENGELIFLQRLDHQIKLRGFRIEPGEIEAALNLYPGVRQSVVVLCRDSAVQPFLAAYLQTHDGAAPPDTELRCHLREFVPDYMVPATFISLERLPQTPNGKIDRKALPRPERCQQQAAKGVIEPRNALELQLVRVWREVLGVEHIGIRDDFFDLGGHSLNAVALVTEMEKALGRPLALSTLLRYHNVERIADYLRRHESAVSDPYPLVVFQAAGQRPPLFFIHPVGGNALCYLELSRLLGADQPCFGLQMEQAEPTGQVEIGALAKRYLELIQHTHPGPFRIAGWSFGGLVALEINRLLLEAGASPAPPILLDTPILAPRADGELIPTTTLGDFMVDLARVGGSEIALPPNPQGGQAEEAGKLYRLALHGDLLPHSTSAARFQEMFRIYKQNRDAMFRFELCSYPADVRLIHVRGDAEGYLARWRAVVAGTIDATHVEGDHYSLLRQPTVRRLAELILQ